MKLFFGPGINQPVFAATDVRDYLPEDKKHHYSDGFSMAEAAKSWVAAEGYLPQAIAAVVETKELNAAHFEFPTKVWGRGTSMTDVMAFLPSSVIAVEAKVNEPFDELVSEWIYEEIDSNPRSPPHRQKVIRRYAKAFGVDYECLLQIRYQLLHRTLCAAIAANAKGLSQAWMIVQYFPAGDGDGHQTNRTDFDHYVDLVGSTPVLKGVPIKIVWVQDGADSRA
jgi:hypothetical protein